MKPGPKPKNRTGIGAGTLVCITCQKSQPVGEFYKDKNRPSGLYPECKSCVLAKRKSNYRKNPSKYVLATRRYNEALKRDAIDAYGGKCSCCGEAHREFLTIDHTKNDGKKHREATGGTKGVLQWLKALGYPQDGYVRVLCYNCHMSRTFLGYCPHERQSAIS